MAKPDLPGKKAVKIVYVFVHVCVVRGFPWNFVMVVAIRKKLK